MLLIQQPKKLLRKFYVSGIHLNNQKPLPLPVVPVSEEPEKILLIKRPCQDDDEHIPSQIAHFQKLNSPFRKILRDWK